MLTSGGAVLLTQEEFGRRVAAALNAARAGRLSAKGRKGEA